MVMGAADNRRKIVISDAAYPGDSHRFYGIGYSSHVVNFQVDDSGDSFAFCAGSTVSTSTEVMRVTGTGSVGIGTTAPAAACALQVNSISTAYNYAPTVSISDGPADTTGAYGMVNLTRPSGFDGKAHLSLIRQGNTVANIGFYSTTNTIAIANGGQTMSTANGIFLTQGNNVGIGNTSPYSKLDVNGILGVNNGVAATSPGQYQGVIIFYTGTGGTGYGSIMATNPGSTYNPLCLNSAGGNVGIGTTTPQTTLHVNGVCRITTTNTDALYWYNNATTHPIGGLGYSADYDSGWVGLYSNNVNTIAIRANGVTTFNGGNVGIGTASPVSLLDVRGNTNIYANVSIYTTNSQPLVITHPAGPYDWHVGSESTGKFKILAGTYGGVELSWAATSWAASSDRRLKEDIEPRIDCLSRISALQPVSYRMINRPSSITKKTLGLIAQDVIDIIPEVVNESWNEEKQETYYTLTYTELIPECVGAIRELNAQVSTLTARLTAAGIA